MVKVFRRDDFDNDSEDMPRSGDLAARVIEQRDLIILRAGTRSLHNTCPDHDVSRSWDLVIHPYEEIAPIRAERVMVSNTVPGLKWAGLKILLAQRQYWRDYRYILLPHDDLFASQEVWLRFFDRCTQYGARLAQPVLTQKSYFSYLTMMHCTELPRGESDSSKS